ncbi:MAG: phospho-N-acetylmuramoyl-pentapeptide-transferase [Endomicrobium sp.]|jgi:phospho-N-acetylmuramoyl-pentapeptide-transferase|nr:phospho-N-acetylmuramoyl-pentapeptide-transferase [Endomicrobium sp.]
MLYYIFCYLDKISTISQFKIFKYLNFRLFGIATTSFLICLFAYPYTINKLKNLKIKQITRIDGPEMHFKKNNTPTMGGIIIFLSVFVSTMLWAKLNNRFIIWFLIGSVWFTFLGFCDDYLKIKKKNVKGLSKKCKLFWQSAFSILLSIYLFFYPQNHEFVTSISIPFFKNIIVNIHYLYALLVIIIIAGSSNAVNLTDGLDGIAAWNVVIAVFTLSVFAYLSGNIYISKHLYIINVVGSEEISIFLFAIIGSCLGFLWYNSYPADIFMGDTGSLFLGGILGMTSIFIKQEIILILIGGIFFIEALSVLIQIFYYKKTKKKIFKMAPIHHHFEMLGISETKITIRFLIAGIIFSIFSIISLKPR